MQIIMKILNGILSVYMLLLFIRILLTWFRGPSMGRPVEILKSITDPYLNWFRRFRFLVLGSFDFSPLLAFITLGVALNITSTLAAYGKITMGLILAYTLSSLWSAASFLLTIFFIMAAVRYGMYLFGASAYNNFARTLDNMLNPILDYFRKLFFRQSFIAQNRLTGITALGLLVIIIAGKFLIGFVVNLLVKLPF